MPLVRSLACAALLVAVLPATALAEHEGRPPAHHTPDTVETAHVKVHYHAGTFGEAQTVAAAVEQAYMRLVVDAGLRAPIDDGDGKVDVYIRTPPSNPGFRGGSAARDSRHTDSEGIGQAGFIYLTPEMEATDLRFRGAHELFHVIARSYTGIVGFEMEEGFSNWAAEWSLADIDPGDHNIGQPEVPFDCYYGSFQGKGCGNGYRHWLWIQRQVEDFGAGFVSGIHDRLRSACQTSCTGAWPAALEQELAARTGIASGADALRLRIGDYWRRVLDPGGWSTSAVNRIYELNGGPPTAVISEFIGDEPLESAVEVNHQAAAFANLSRWGELPAGPGDRLRVRVQTSVPLLPGNAPAVALLDGPNWSRELVQLQPSAGGFEGTVGWDPARHGRATLVFVNDGSTDAAPFDWSAEIVRGEPTPPPNDLRSRPRKVKVGTHSADIAYAGGKAHEESPSFCTDRSGRGAGQGVWFLFTAPTRGSYRFDTSGSDFASVLNVIPLKSDPRVRVPRPRCSRDGSPVTARWPAGQRALVYVARVGSDLGLGHAAKLEIDGPTRHDRKCRRALAAWKKDRDSAKRRRAVVKHCGVTVLPER